MRDRSYLTPGAQVVVGTLVLIACFAWLPTIFILFLVVLGRYFGSARRGGARGLVVAVGVLISLTVVFVYVAPGFAVVGVGLALAALAWLASSRVGKRTVQT